MALGDQNDIFRRIKATLPARWYSSTTPGNLTSTPVLDGLLNGPSWAVSWLYDLLEYVAEQRRIATASGLNLDLISRDFFGHFNPRFQGEVDDTFRARIKSNLFAPKATRAAIIAAARSLTGFDPSVFEPRNATDTGGWGSLGMSSGTGLGYGVAGGYGSLNLPFQAFVKAFRPHGGGIAGVGGYYGFGSGLTAFGGYGVGSLEYVGKKMIPANISDELIYDTIAAAAPAASVMWVNISNFSGSTQHPDAIIARAGTLQDAQSILAAARAGGTSGLLVVAQDGQFIAATAIIGTVSGILTAAQADQLIDAAVQLSAIWNPNDLTNITLAGGNLTASTSTASQAGIRSTAPLLSGTGYMELTTTTIASADRWGVATALWSESDAAGLGGDLHSLSLSSTGSVRMNNVVLGSAVVPTAGGILSIAVNRDLNRVWFGAGGTPTSSTTGSQVIGTSGLGPVITGPASGSVTIGANLSLAGLITAADTIWPHAGNATMFVTAVGGGMVSMTISGTPVSGSGTNVCSVTDTDAHIQAALATLIYTAPSSNVSGLSIDVSITDQLGQLTSYDIPITLLQQTTAWSVASSVITGTQTAGTVGPIITGPASTLVQVGTLLDLTGACSASDVAWPHAGSPTMVVFTQSGGTVAMTISGTPVTGSGGSSVTVSDTDANIQAALGTLKYTAPSTGSSDTVHISIFDQFGQSNQLDIPVTLSPIGDPSVGAGGYDISTLDAGPLFIAFGTAHSGSSAIANFGQTAFTRVAPPGFPAWSTSIGTPPTPPTGLVASLETPTSVRLTWTP